MRKHILLLGISLSLSTTLLAQPGIIETRPANDADGKILTMEETILSRELVPEYKYFSWKGGHELAEERPSPAKPRFKLEYKEGNLALLEKADSGKYEHVHYIEKTDNPNLVFGEVVSRNEFGIESGTFWSPDSTKVAYYIKDESQVSNFPLLDITTRTGSLVNIKYPMAGMPSELVGLRIYDFETQDKTILKFKDFVSEEWSELLESYLTNITWAPDSKHLFIQTLSRSQKELRLEMYSVEGKYVKTLLTESNEKYVEPSDPLWFLKDSNTYFIYRTANRDNYRNLYLCDTTGNLHRLTCVDADVQYIGNDGEYVYYTSAEVSPVENHLFRIKIGSLKRGLARAKFGKAERLTHEPGWHSVQMSPDYTQFIDHYSSITVPRIMNLRKANGDLIRNLLTAEDPTKDYAYTEISLGTVKSADGKYDNYYRLIKPLNFDPTKKYPLILYVYGGPHSQMIRNTHMAQLRRWEMYMAQRGYIVYVQDNRGTQNRGLDFEQVIHRQCGQAEMADQMEGMKMLLELPYVDKERIGVHGWSYGGFMTISLAINYPEIFKVAVAGGPVIDWKWYEVMYGERYMETPEVNPEGYEKTSLIPKAKDLKSKLLICQGAIDPVVLWQHSLSFVQECIKHNIQVDYFPYPCSEHNMIGKTRVHLMDKVSLYFEDYL